MLRWVRLKIARSNTLLDARDRTSTPPTPASNKARNVLSEGKKACVQQHQSTQKTYSTQVWMVQVAKSSSSSPADQLYTSTVYSLTHTHKHYETIQYLA